ncbi:abhydrolase domain-containing protein 13, partial [Phenoliferia sp. Uapishka_3]
MTTTCSACHATDTLEYDSTASGLVCNSCGTVDRNSASESLEVLGRVLEDDGGVEGGRSYLRNGGMRLPEEEGGDQKGQEWSKGKREYNEQRAANTEIFMRSILAHFDVLGLFERARYIFQLARREGEFRWGQRARTVAVACVYLASRERDKNIRLYDLAVLTEIEIGVLTRCQELVKEWTHITITENEPAIFLPQIITHIRTLVALPSPPIAPAPKKSTISKAWTPANLKWLRALPYDQVLSMGQELLAFARELDLILGRQPEPVSIAIALVAMEAVARTETPRQCDVLHELAASIGASAATSSDRYRELMALLKDYAPRLPWLMARAKVMKRKDVIANAGDIIRFWAALDQKKKASVVLEKTAAKGLVDEEEEGDDEGSSPDESSTASPPKVRDENGLIATKRSLARLKRPAEYMRQEPRLAKRARTIEQVSSSLLSSFSTSPALNVAPQASPTDWENVPLPAFTITAKTKGFVRCTGREAALPAAPHDPYSVKARRALLAGVDVGEIYDGAPEEEKDAPTRLHELLWTKTEAEIEDDELFDFEELEGYVRTPFEIGILSRSEKFREMPDQVWSAPTKARNPNAKPRKKRTMAEKNRGRSGRLEEEEKERKRRAVENGDRDESPMSDGFGAKRSSKIDDATRLRLMKLFGEENDGISKEDGEQLELELAMDAVGEGVEESEEEEDFGDDEQRIKNPFKRWGSRTNVPLPTDYGMPFEDVSLTTPDGVKIKAYLMLDEKAPEERPTVLLYHANAGNVGHRLPIAQVFYRKMRCNVLALSYRGYGKSEGSPSEKGLRLDAQTALDYVLSHPKLEKTQIYCYGQSIGGAVAIDLTSRNTQRVHGLIVENTFLSLPKLVPNVLPFVAPFLFLLHQIWPSEDSIILLPPSFPVLFLSGKQDELVPPEHMKQLFKLCASGKKEWKEFAQGTHNDTCIQPFYFAHILSFITLHSPAAYASSAPTLTPSSDPEKQPISPSSDNEKASSTTSTDEEGSFEMVNQEEAIGAGSLGPEEIAKEGIRRVEEKL